MKQWKCNDVPKLRWWCGIIEDLKSDEESWDFVLFVLALHE